MTKETLIAVHQRIQPYIHNTPVISSTLLNEIAGADIVFKCENFQKTGSYKIRGATNAILQLPSEQREQGVVTHSSGNFAQALSLAAKNLGVKAYIVMPSTAPQVKKDAVKTYGGEIIECEPTLKAREITADQIVREKNTALLHPSNDTDVILGQGTTCKELLETHPKVDCVVVPVGGGGLIAGTILSARYFGTACQVVGAEPFEADDAYRSLESGTIETNTTTNTIADGLRSQLGDKNFPIIKEGVDRIIRVTEQEIIDALSLLWLRLKIVCEPSSAVAFAALLREKDRFEGRKVGVIISGGNVDLGALPF